MLPIIYKTQKPASTLALYILMLSVISTLWTSHFITIWVMMEISLITTLILMKATASIRYFMIQSMSSIMLFVGAVAMTMETLFWLSMVMKLGGAPFHWWVPLIYMDSSWLVIFLISTIMKIIPCAILDMSPRHNNNINSTLMTASLMVGAMGGLYQTSLKKLLAYSSITHIGWLIVTLLLSTSMWIMYITPYFFNMAFLLLKFRDTLGTYMMLLSLAGLPPLLGFFPKVLILKYLTTSLFPMIPLLMSAMVALVYYTSLFINKMMETTSTMHKYTLLWFTSLPLLYLTTFEVWGTFKLTNM